ncbi:Nce102 protein [Martiniozyma asiatica (nom. inval.)]|nr:Nce102 protein [Martiniozyma asiatica]
MLSYGDISLRVVNFIFLTIVLGLTASLAATTVNEHNPQVNFCVFAAAWGLLSSFFYGILAYFLAFLASPLFLAVLDFLNFVFTFAGATALAVAIRCHSCNNSDYVDNNKVTQGVETRCRKAQASVAFLYFSVFVFLFSLVIQVLSVLKNGFFSHSSPKTPRTGVPTMAQV